MPMFNQSPVSGDVAQVSAADWLTPASMPAAATRPIVWSPAGSLAVPASTPTDAGWRYRGTTRDAARSSVVRGLAFLGDSITNVVSSQLNSSAEYATYVMAACSWSPDWCFKWGAGGMGLTVPGNAGKTVAQAVLDMTGNYNGRVASHVVVLLGTNDLSTADLATIKSEYSALIFRLAMLGYEPIVCELPPRNDLTSTTRAVLHGFNTWVGRFARQYGFRCAHIYSYCADQAGSGTWKSGLNSDAVHPNAAGASAIAQAVLQAMSDDYEWRPYLIGDINDASVWPYGLFLTDTRTSGGTAETAGDGIPDFIGKANTQTGWTNALADESGVLGKVWTYTPATGGSAVTTRTTRRAATPGDIFAFGAMYDTSASDADGPVLALAPKTATTLAWHDGVVTRLSYMSYSGKTHKSSGWRTVYGEYVIPTGAVSALFDIETVLGATASAIKLARLTIRNITAAGAL